MKGEGIQLDISMVEGSDLRIKILRSGEPLMVKDIDLVYFLDRPDQSFTLSLDNILNMKKLF